MIAPVRWSGFLKIDPLYYIYLELYLGRMQKGRWSGFKFRPTLLQIPRVYT